MTDELDLDAIEALANAATLGPWVVSTDLWDGMPVGSMLTGYSQDKQQDYSVHIVGKSPPDDISDAATDAAFIAASRSAVPALVAEVRRLRAALAVFADPENWISPELGPEWNDWHEINRPMDYARAILDGKPWPPLPDAPQDEGGRT